jgi:hypothetical protein
MRALAWHGLEDVRVDSVPEDGAVKVVPQP